MKAAITRDRFVLLVGESTAGKSRAAYEAMRELFAAHRLVEPAGRSATQAAVDAMLGEPQAVLWLDDIERFLGEGGLTGTALSGILAGKRHSIIATMRAEEYSYFNGSSPTVADANRSRDTIRQGWEVLRLATRIDLARPWSNAEIQEARRIDSGDPRIAEALTKVDHFGVAEYLAAGPQLLATWRDAWAPGAHPRAAALVMAAVDARRAGIHRPLSLDVLTQAHEAYLGQRGGHRLRPEPVADAIDWATTPLHATSSLLIPGGDGLLIAFDYLIDAIARESIPADALAAFIDAAQPEELKDIGRVAWSWDQLDQAETAFERASSKYSESRVERGYVIRERDGQAAQRLYLQKTVDELIGRLGYNHEDAIEARLSLAWDCGYGLSIRTPLRELKKLEEESRRAFEQFHPIMIHIRLGVGYWLAEGGEVAAASNIFLQLFHACLENLDEPNWLTYSVMMNYANCFVTGSQGQGIVDFYDDFESWMRNRRAPAQAITSLRYERARALQEAGWLDHALAGFQSILSDEERMHGHLNATTLNAHCELLKCLAAKGEHTQAIRRGKELLEECQAEAHATNINTQFIRLTIATMIGEAGDVAEAIRIIAELREERRRLYGEDQPEVRAMDHRLRYWTAVRLADEGLLARSAVELRQLSEDLMISSGINSELRKKVAESRSRVTMKMRKGQIDGSRRTTGP
ncbi:hypothetical protein Q5425_31400 [Amycolatopsis sp. A133]|uniref:hypothetical protein n=1 Tax=Amycolatopsis sp. A133 TaxID=3064472 RepID=UPI0027F20090|nr:hypothetical protein [Amycolatopsis sp. A133]MDQ7808262.1 hypothetical protein [Amycolatopsis sp. A133]